MKKLAKTLNLTGNCTEGFRGTHVGDGTLTGLNRTSIELRLTEDLRLDVTFGGFLGDPWESTFPVTKDLEAKVLDHLADFNENRVVVVE